MSRDFTPKEMLLAEKMMVQNNGPSITDIFQLSIVSGEKKKSFYTAEEIEHRMEFPLFGKLIHHFEALYQELYKYPNGLDMLHDYEQKLTSYIETNTGDLQSPLIQWYKGKLDKNFYYAERNEELFVEHLLNAAKDKHALENQRSGLDRMIEKIENDKKSSQTVSNVNKQKDPEILY